METCRNFLNLFSEINWLWYFVSVIVAYGAGAIWFSFLFQKAWIRVFKIDMPEKNEPTGAVLTMSIQLLVTALLGLMFFVLVPVSKSIAVFALIAFCGWQKGTLKFRYTKWREFFTAAIVEVGYTFLVGVIFILFALL